MAQVIFERLPDGIGRVWFNDPDALNAMSLTMAREFRDLVKSLKSDTPRLLIISGKGKAFSAGGDLEMLEAKTSMNPEQNRQGMLEFYDSFLSVRELNIPLIAAINGAAIGAGLCLASACDIRLCSDRARLGFTFVKLGLHPGMGGTFFLPLVVGSAHARELLLTGRIIDAAHALRIGLVSEVVDVDTIEKRSIEIAREILANGPESVTQLLMTLRSADAGLMAALEREAFCQSINYQSDQFKEGIRAVREKRPAQFI